MKKRTRIFKMLSILMSVLLILNSLSFYAVAQDTAAVAPEEEVTMVGGLALKADNDNIYNKIHFYLGDSENTTIDDATELAEATQKVNAMNVCFANSANQRSIETAETVNLTVQFESNFLNTAKYKEFKQERETLKDMEAVRDFRQRLNAYSKEYHNALATQSMSLLSDLEYNSIEHIEYSPFVVVNMDATMVTTGSLIDMAESNIVVSVSVSREEQPESTESVETILNGINAYDIVDNETYSGWGIRVGIYESKGICDTTNINLVGKDITIRNTAATVTNHATAVTSILTAIAPNAEYYVSEVTGYGIQWFLDNYCDIVNCSFGYTGNVKNADGTYTDGEKQYKNYIDGVYDYQVAVHFVTVVVAAGNYKNDPTDPGYNPQRKVTSPGYAYNVITVGGVKELSSPLGSIVYDDRATYVTTTEKVKPNISAFHQVTIPNFGTGAGTSFAAPQVAGCLALLLEHDWSYVTYPERMMSVLMSTARKTDDYVEDVGNFDDRVGAGVVDLQRMIDSDLSFQMRNTDGTSGTEIAWVDVELNEGDELQVGLAWIVTAIPLSATTYNPLVTDYDLIIYHPDVNGSITTSISSDSNVELIRLTAEESGTYSIGIYQNSSIDSGNEGDYLSLTYNITN